MVSRAIHTSEFLDVWSYTRGLRALLRGGSLVTFIFLIRHSPVNRDIEIKVIRIRTATVIIGYSFFFLPLLYHLFFN